MVVTLFWHTSINPPTRSQLFLYDITFNARYVYLYKPVIGLLVMNDDDDFATFSDIHYYFFVGQTLTMRLRATWSSLCDFKLDT